MTSIRALSGRINVPMTVRLLVGGVLVALVVTVLPVLSTSGQHQIHTISTLFASLGAGALFALAAGKLLFAQLCIECRWTGGDIFPIMFAALLHGCALAKLLPGCQPVVVVMTVAFCTAIVLVGNVPARRHPHGVVLPGETPALGIGGHAARLGRYAGDRRGVGRGETPDVGKGTGTLLTGHARVPTRG